MKKIKLLIAGFILSLLLAGCSGKNMENGSSTAYNTGSAYDSGGGAYPAAEEMAEYDMVETEVQDAKADVNTSLSGTNGVTSTAKGPAQKLIKDVSISAETKKFDDLYENLVDKVNTLGGYIETSQINGNSYSYSQLKNGYLVARIPSENLEQFVKIVKDNANVTNKSESTRDVTLQYVDMESHVNALRAEQESLLKILEAADKLEDIIKVQSQLTQVRYEIESYESQLRTYDNLVTYSTVTIHLEEVERETVVATKTYGEQLFSKLNQNLYDIKEGFLSFTIWFISSIPYIVIWAVIIICGVFVLKKIFKKVNIGKEVYNKSELSNPLNEEKRNIKKEEKKDLNKEE